MLPAQAQTAMNAGKEVTLNLDEGVLGLLSNSASLCVFLVLQRPFLAILSVD